jgi:hypothetical protein
MSDVTRILNAIEREDARATDRPSPPACEGLHALLTQRPSHKVADRTLDTSGTTVARIVTCTQYDSGKGSDMTEKESKKRNGGLEQGIWATGQVQRTLDEKGVALIKGENPGFADARYCLYLGIRVGKSGPVHYEIPHSGEDDHFYARIYKSGSFDIHLKAQSLSKQDVTIVWWASSLGTPPWIGPTGGPTPAPPPPTLPPLGLTIIRFNASDFPGRYVNEVPGIDADFIRRLTGAGMENLAALASADATDVARILNTSEVRAMGIIYEARGLLRGR